MHVLHARVGGSFVLLGGLGLPVVVAVSGDLDQGGGLLLAEVHLGDVEVCHFERVCLFALIFNYKQSIESAAFIAITITALTTRVCFGQSNDR